MGRLLRMHLMVHEAVRADFVRTKRLPVPVPLLILTLTLTLIGGPLGSPLVQQFSSARSSQGNDPNTHAHPHPNPDTNRDPIPLILTPSSD